jgi:hypothetical protein
VPGRSKPLSPLYSYPKLYVGDEACRDLSESGLGREYSHHVNELAVSSPRTSNTGFTITGGEGFTETAEALVASCCEKRVLVSPNLLKELDLPRYGRHVSVTQRPPLPV